MFEEFIGKNVEIVLSQGPNVKWYGSVLAADEKYLKLSAINGLGRKYHGEIFVFNIRHVVYIHEIM